MKDALLQRRWFLPLVLIGTGMLFFFPLWSGDGLVYSKHSDVVVQFLSIKAVGQRSVSEEDRFPLWNPSMNAGAPAFANPQSAYLYPVNLVYAFLPLDTATNLAFLLNALLAGLSAYGFARLHLRSREAALFCGIAYMTSFRYVMLVYTGWLPNTAMYALTPLLFWAVEGVLRRPNPRRGVVLGAVGAAALLQGDMQQLYYAGISCAVYAAVRMRKMTVPARRRAIAAISGAALLGVMLGAPALLPRLEYASLSTRSTASYDFFLGRPPVLGDLATLIDPMDGGGARNEFWEGNFYFGFWIFPLWAFALYTGGRRSWALLGALVAMVALCFDSPLLRLFFDYVPGFNQFRLSPRILFMAQLVACLFAAMGVDAIATATKARGASWPLGRAALLLLCVLPFADSQPRMLRLITTKPLSEAMPRHEVHSLLDRRVATGRVTVLGRNLIPYGMAGYYQIDMINGYGGLTLAHYVDYLSVLQYGTREAIPKHPVIWTDTRQLARLEMLRALDVQYVVTDGSIALDTAWFERVARYPDVPVFVFYKGLGTTTMDVWRAKTRAGPAYFSSSLHPVEDEMQALEALALGAPAEAAYVLGFDQDPSEIDSSGGSVQMIARESNRYEFEIDSLGHNFLILSQVWYPGWRAYLDGVEVPVYRTNHALIGCVVPAGEHRLRLEMTSMPLRIGAVLFGVAGVAAVAVFAMAPRARRSSPSQR